jgi:hypothetical protein
MYSMRERVYSLNTLNLVLKYSALISSVQHIARVRVTNSQREWCEERVAEEPLRYRRIPGGRA